MGSDEPRKKIAIVGAGMSGLAAYWALRNSRHDVELIELSSHLSGGLTERRDTVVRGQFCSIDASIALFNRDACPNLSRFLNHLRVPLVEKPFSFSSFGSPDFPDPCWGSMGGILTFFRDLWDLNAWTVRVDMIRFAYIGLDYLRNLEAADPAHKVQPAEEERLGVLLENHQISLSFLAGYLVPLMGVLFNISDWRTVDNLPAGTVFQFLWDNHLLGPGRAWPKLSVVQPGTDFNEVMKNSVPQRSIRFNAPVHHVKLIMDNPAAWGLEIHAGRDIQIVCYDHVVFAIPARMVLVVLGAQATSQEIQILSGLMGSDGEGYVHADRKFMPPDRRSWGLVNYVGPPLIATPVRNTTPCLTYWLGEFQDEENTNTNTKKLFHTFNPDDPPSKSRQYLHARRSFLPVDFRALVCQSRLGEIQNIRGLSFCGKWTGFGGPEDSVRSAFEVAVHHLGAQLPFDLVQGANAHRPVRPPRKRELIARWIFEWWPHAFFLLNVFLWVTSPFHRFTSPLCRAWATAFGTATRRAEAEEEEEDSE